MRRIGALLTLLVVCAACGSGSSGAKSAGGQPASTATPTISASASVPAYTPPPTPDPNVRFTQSCDYLLGNFTDYSQQGYRFVARAVLHNTGNVGAVVGVKAFWVQEGTKPITKGKVVRVAYGSSRVVNFTVPVSSDNVDEIQSAQGSGRICHVRASIIDVFGNPH